MSGDISTKEWASEFMREQWKKSPDDEIGGWCVILEREERTVGDGATAIASFCSEEIADHVVAAHRVYLQLLQGLADKEQLEQEVADDIHTNSQPPPGRAPES